MLYLSLKTKISGQLSTSWSNCLSWMWLWFLCSHIWSELELTYKTSTTTAVSYNQQCSSMRLFIVAILSIVLKANACILCTMPRLKSRGISLRPVDFGNELLTGQIKEFFVLKEQPLYRQNVHSTTTDQGQTLPILIQKNDMKSTEGKENIEIKEILISWIRWYRNTLSPIMPPNCRFLPSCSNYAMQAIAEYGSYKWVWQLWLTRIILLELEYFL